MAKDRRLKKKKMSLLEEQKNKNDFIKCFSKVEKEFDIFVVTLPSGSYDLTDNIKKRMVA